MAGGKIFGRKNNSVDKDGDSDKVQTSVKKTVKSPPEIARRAVKEETQKSEDNEDKVVRRRVSIRKIDEAKENATVQAAKIAINKRAADKGDKLPSIVKDDPKVKEHIRKNHAATKEEKAKEAAEKKPEVKAATKPKKLPHINELFALLTEHQAAMSRAINNQKWGQVRGIEAKLKENFEKMGIVDCFDWSEDEEKKTFNRKVDAMSKK